MFARIARGISMPLSSFGYMTEKKLWGYTIFPLLLTAVIVIAMAVIVWVYMLGYIGEMLTFDLNDWPKFLQYVAMTFQIILKIVILYLMFTFLLRVFLTLFSILVIPFLSPLVEKILVEEGISTLKISHLEMIGYIFSSIVYNSKLLIAQTFFAVLLLFTGPLQPMLSFGVSSYYVGRSYFDYVFELLGRPRDFDKLAQGYRVEATGVGAFSHVFLFVPFIGAVFTPILCVVAATRLFAAKVK
jgi:uncharacterized protein involved in cysteine biosynthesis